MQHRLLPILYAIEFLMALVAVYTVWGELGGQDALDYMPWYWKAAIGFGASTFIVGLTTAIGRSRWRIAICALVLAALAICAGLLSYYYQLNDSQDQEDVPASVTPTARLSVGPAIPRG